jgi:hypothetical protein
MQHTAHNKEPDPTPDAAPFRLLVRNISKTTDTTAPESFSLSLPSSSPFSFQKNPTPE